MQGSTFDYHIARIAAGAYDDAQDVRKSTMNRIRDIVRKRNEGIPFDEVEDEKEDDDYDSRYKDENLTDLIANMHERGDFTTEEYEYLHEMLDIVDDAVAVENRYTDVMKIVRAEPIFYEWLEHVFGVSTTRTAKLINRIGHCEKFDRVSQLWKHAGLAPGQKRERGKKAGYDPRLKTLAWQVADGLLKGAEKSHFRMHYYEPYKEKQEYRMHASACKHCGKSTLDHYRIPKTTERYCTDDTDQRVHLSDFHLPPDVSDDASPPWNQGHADARARRYLAKGFLKHYWYVSRRFAGLPTPEEWVITHGGHDHVEESWDNPAHAFRELHPEGKSLDSVAPPRVEPEEDDESSEAAADD